MSDNEVVAMPLIQPSHGGVRIDHVTTSGTFELDGGSWEVDNNVWVIGDERDRYDEVIAVWYPSLAAFASLVSDPDILEARDHRVERLERSALICCAPADYVGTLSNELQR